MVSPSGAIIEQKQRGDKWGIIVTAADFSLKVDLSLFSVLNFGIIYNMYIFIRYIKSMSRKATYAFKKK